MKHWEHIGNLTYNDVRSVVDDAVSEFGLTKGSKKGDALMDAYYDFNRSFGDFYWKYGGKTDIKSWEKKKLKYFHEPIKTDPFVTDLMIKASLFFWKAENIIGKHKYSYIIKMMTGG